MGGVRRWAGLVLGSGLTLLRYGASTTQVTRHHDLMTRFLMITFDVLSIQLTRFLMMPQAAATPTNDALSD